jgi:hypothetical protein
MARVVVVKMCCLDVGSNDFGGATPLSGDL